MATWSATVGVFFLPLACEPHHTHSLLSDSQRERVCVWCSRRYWLLAGRRTTWLSPVSSQPRPTTVRWPCCWNVNPRVTCGGRPVGLFQQLPSSQEANHAEPVKKRKKNRRKADDSSTTITASSSSRKSLTRRLIASFDRRDNHFRWLTPNRSSLSHIYSLLLLLQEFFLTLTRQMDAGGKFLLFVREANTFCSFIFSIPTQWTFDLRGMSMTFTTNIW